MDSNTNHEIVNVTLMDKKYQIKCPMNEKSALLKAASFLEQRLLKIKHEAQGAPLEHTILLAALNISHDYLNQNNTEKEDLQTLKQSLKQLQQKLILANNPINLN